MRQQPYGSCLACDGRTVIVATENPRQFTWRCESCRTHGVISWATIEDAPQWQGDQQQLDLYAPQSRSSWGSEPA